jgi:hypothetical protein
MTKYGIISNDELDIVAKDTEGAKPIRYAGIPEFDQTLQAVFESGYAEYDDYIFVNVEVRDVVQDDSGDEMFF